MFYALGLLVFAGVVRAGPADSCEAVHWSRFASGLQPILSAPAFADNRDSLARLYLISGGIPIWFRGGVPTRQAYMLVGRLMNAHRKGLRPADYDAGNWVQWLTYIPAALASNPGCRREELDLDLAFSTSVMRYVSDLSIGRVEPARLGLHLDVTPRHRDPARMLLSLSLAEEPGQILDALEPPFRRYRALLQALQQYRELALDPRLNPPLQVPRRAVRPGEPYADLERLVYRLWRLGDLAQLRKTPDGVYSEQLAQGVRRFQRRHGLEQDGIIGRDTFAQLNVPLTERVRQILLTLERWRWLPHDLGHRPIVINVPEYRLYAFESDGSGGYREALTMDVIVGQSFPRHQTPVFRADMRYIVFAPYWNVPYSITRRELLPMLEADPEYLAKKRFEIVDSYHSNAKVLPQTADNIALLASGDLFLRQMPGRHNALGEAKFMFPNDHAVYLHGTPAKRLFVKHKRDFSHGCIRLADPPRLAEHVLSQEAGWDRARVDALIGSGERSLVGLSMPLAVYVLYGTALVDEDGTVRFLRDVYGHDGRMARVLGMGARDRSAI